MVGGGRRGERAEDKGNRKWDAWIGCLLLLLLWFLRLFCVRDDSSNSYFFGWVYVEWGLSGWGPRGYDA